MITRRALFGVLAGSIAAPIVVRSGLLMPVKAMPELAWRSPDPDRYLASLEDRDLLWQVTDLLRLRWARVVYGTVDGRLEIVRLDPNVDPPPFVPVWRAESAVRAS